MLLDVAFYVCLCAAIAGCMFIPLSPKDGFTCISGAVVAYTIVWCVVKLLNVL